MFSNGKQEQILAGDRIRDLSRIIPLDHKANKPDTATFICNRTNNDLIIPQLMLLVYLVTPSNFHRALTIFVMKIQILNF